jgi:hypothetical protein
MSDSRSRRLASAPRTIAGSSASRTRIIREQVNRPAMREVPPLVREARSRQAERARNVHGWVEAGRRHARGLPAGALRKHPPGQFGLECYHRQRVAEQIVEVSSEALPLLGDRQPGQFGPRGAELGVARAEIPHHQHQLPDPGEARHEREHRARRRAAERSAGAGEQGAQDDRVEAHARRRNECSARSAVGEQESPTRTTARASARWRWPGGRRTAAAPRRHAGGSCSGRRAPPRTRRTTPRDRSPARARAPVRASRSHWLPGRR